MKGNQQEIVSILHKMESLYKRLYILEGGQEDTKSDILDEVWYTDREGGPWIKWPDYIPHPEPNGLPVNPNLTTLNRFNSVVFFALKTTDGRIWDCISGWRDQPTLKADTASTSEIDWQEEASSGRCFVEVRDHDNQDWSYPILLSSYRPCALHPFWRENTGWRQARIATIQGVWRSWHGGECPVPDDADVSSVDRSGVRRLLHRAGAMTWGHTGADSDIVAFCWLP